MGNVQHKDIFFPLSKHFSLHAREPYQSSHSPVTCYYSSWLAAGSGSLFGALTPILEMNMLEIFGYFHPGYYNKFLTIIYARKLHLYCLSNGKKILSVQLREVLLAVSAKEQNC